MKKHVNLENFIYLTIFLLPAYLIKIKIFGLPTNALELLMAAVIIVTGRKLGFGIFLKTGLGMAIGLVFFGLLTSIFISGNYAAGLGIIKSWFVLPFLFALAVKNAIPEEKKAKVHKAFFMSALAAAIISLAYYFAGETTFDGRLKGVFNSPNYLAMYLAPGIIIGFVCFKGNKRAFGIGLAIISAAFYLTYSYAAWLAAACSLAILQFIGKQKKEQAHKFSHMQKFISAKKVAAIGILAFAMIVFSQWNNQKFQDLKNLNSRSSFQSRIMIWKASYKILQDNWILGVGPGSFQEKYLAYQKHFPPYLEWAVPHPHNLFLNFWLSGGLMAATGFVYLMMSWFKKIWRKEKNTIWLASFGVILYFLLHGLVDTTYFKNDLALIFWLNALILL